MNYNYIFTYNMKFDLYWTYSFLVKWSIYLILMTSSVLNFFYFSNNWNLFFSKKIVFFF